MFKIELKHRQCLFTSFFIDLLWPSKDIVTVDIPISVPDYSLPDGSLTSHIPLELVICRKRDMKSMLTNTPNLKTFVSPIQPRHFKVDSSSNNSLIVLGESEEAVNHVIDA
jgi:hypothetical protein